MFSKKFQISDFINIRLVGAELFRANGQTHRQTEGQTEMTKLIVAFCNCLNVSKKSISLLNICVLKIIVFIIAYSAETNV
jgi:hypothetical protein